ncbi:MAG: OprO/OprP family phosphate-selective porin [Flavobacteriaceae bacterium]|nr:OprO/OprP family phosphate-selective porin [Flavobacteriaceae bacterium]
MRKYILVALFAMGSAVFAQQKSISERLNLIEKKSDKFNVFFNFQSSFDAVKEKDVDLQTAFKARQLRLEFRGKISDKLSYRFRHRLNKSNAGQTLDNLAKATDLMYMTYQATDKFALTVGKQCQMWGGFEFDLNPMNIYEYSDFIENMDNFMLGVNFGFQLAPNHELNVQITDTRNSTFNKIYGSLRDKDGKAIVASNSPLTYIVNWNGCLLDGMLQTRWAYGIETQAKDKYSKMLTLGTKLNLEKFQVAFDYMRADQDIDRLNYASGRNAMDVTYNSFITKLEYQPADQWNVFAKYMYETGAIKDVDKNRKSQGYFVGVEHLPFKGEDCRFFLTYVGRSYDVFGVEAPSTNRVSIGMMYRIKAF